MRVCKECEEPIKRDDEIVIVDENILHLECVHLAPSRWEVFGRQTVNEPTYYGTAEDSQIGSAYWLLDDGDYVEEVAE